MADHAHAGAQFPGNNDALWEFPEGPLLTLEDLNDDFNYQLFGNNNPPPLLGWGGLEGNPTDLVSDFDFSSIGSHVEPANDFDFGAAIGEWDGYTPVDFGEALSSLQDSQNFDEDLQESSHVSSRCGSPVVATDVLTYAQDNN